MTIVFKHPSRVKISPYRITAKVAKELEITAPKTEGKQESKPNGPNNMQKMAHELMKRGLVSLYHKTTGLEFGEEDQGTYWHYRKKTMPYHIDYVFVPMTWFANMVSFEIGNFQDWCAPGFSDHAPLTAEFT